MKDLTPENSPKTAVSSNNVKAEETLSSNKKLRLETTSRSSTNQGGFGVLFDIDGVLLRGHTPIPQASAAIKKLMNAECDEFVVPTLFCTNAFGLKKVKADILSKALGVKIPEHLMVMSQSPLRGMTHLHNKTCLISGPEHGGGSVEVARDMGFKNIVTIDDIREAKPYLDWVDRKRWPLDGSKVVEKKVPKIEAIILLGEPVRWETNLQILYDVISCNGDLDQLSPDSMTNHEQGIPIVAVNLDLMWMAKAPTPRFGHGAFLSCLEGIYLKFTGKPLKYDALVGKPSIVTYEYSKKLLSNAAKEMGHQGLNTIYAIGDNPLTDIYGGNLFNENLEQSQLKITKTSTTDEMSVNSCKSILVCTGIYQKNSPKPRTDTDMDHGHRDLPYCEKLTTPDMVVDHVGHAIDKIFDIENNNN